MLSDAIIEGITGSMKIQRTFPPPSPKKHIILIYPDKKGFLKGVILSCVLKDKGTESQGNRDKK